MNGNDVFLERDGCVSFVSFDVIIKEREDGCMLIEEEVEGGISVVVGI